MGTRRFLQVTAQPGRMSLTMDDFRESMAADPEDDESVPLGDALAELAISELA